MRRHIPEQLSTNINYNSWQKAHEEVPFWNSVAVNCGSSSCQEIIAIYNSLRQCVLLKFVTLNTHIVALPRLVYKERLSIKYSKQGTYAFVFTLMHATSITHLHDLY